MKIKLTDVTLFEIALIDEFCGYLNNVFSKPTEHNVLSIIKGGKSDSVIDPELNLTLQRIFRITNMYMKDNGIYTSQASELVTCVDDLTSYSFRVELDSGLANTEENKEFLSYFLSEVLQVTNSPGSINLNYKFSSKNRLPSETSILRRNPKRKSVVKGIERMDLAKGMVVALTSNITLFDMRKELDIFEVLRISFLLHCMVCEFPEFPDYSPFKSPRETLMKLTHEVEASRAKYFKEGLNEG